MPNLPYIHDDLPDEVLERRCGLYRLRRTRSSLTVQLREKCAGICNCQGKFQEEPLEHTNHDEKCPAYDVLAKFQANLQDIPRRVREKMRKRKNKPSTDGE